MGSVESENNHQGLLDSKVKDMLTALREEAATSEEIRSIVDLIGKAGVIMVIDPEKAFDDLADTLERVRIAARMGMKVMEVGGSTDNNRGAETVIPAVRNAIEEVGGDTTLISFPGTSSQVVGGVHAVYSLFLPQLEKVKQNDPQWVERLYEEYFNIIRKGKERNVPVFPVIYFLFKGGEMTSVEKVTKIDAIDVRDGVHVDQVMGMIGPWLEKNDLVMLENGSGSRFANLGGVAKEVSELTGIRSIVTGGNSDPKNVRDITSIATVPTVSGSIFERTPPDKFGDLYQQFRDAHPSCRE